MADQIEFSQGKSVSDLGHEALWFFLHTVIAIVSLIVMVAVVAILHPDSQATTPKLIGTLLALVFPLIVGFIINKRLHSDVATYVWISGLLIFAVACVWVLDLPTGNGLCEGCNAFDKLWRTFFSIDNGSGLLAGNGLAVGSWLPLALFGYAGGARMALDR